MAGCCGEGATSDLARFEARSKGYCDWYRLWKVGGLRLVASKAATDASVSIGDAGGMAKLALLLCAWRCVLEEDPLLLRLSFLIFVGLRAAGLLWIDSRFSSSATANAASGMGSIADSMRSGVLGRGGGGAVNSLLNEFAAMARGVRCLPVVGVVVAEVGQLSVGGVSARHNNEVTGSKLRRRSHF